MKKNVGLLVVMSLVFLTGCSINHYVNSGNDNISYEPVVCQYTSTPTCWTAIDFISTNIKIYGDNTVEVYCSDFYDNGITVEYIYGETFEITEEQKQEVIDALKKHRKGLLQEKGDEDSCDGDFSNIVLFDENGEAIYCCGGLNPSGKSYKQVKSVIFSVIPEDAYRDVHKKATKVLVDYLIENYPEDYKNLAEEYMD